MKASCTLMFYLNISDLSLKSIWNLLSVKFLDDLPVLDKRCELLLFCGLNTNVYCSFLEAVAGGAHKMRIVFCNIFV
jgi:hypothetical protein